MNTSALPIAVAQALLANSPAGIAVFEGDTGECLLANGMLAEITGGSVEALLRLNFRTLVSWRGSGLADAAEATIADGVSRQHESTMQTSFGKSVTLDSSLYRFDFEGKPHLMLVASDVTERRRAEEALAVREQELRTLIETVPDLIVQYDRALRRTYVNPAWEQASGLSAREVINVPAAAIPKVPNPGHAEYTQKIRQVLESGTPQKIGFSWVNVFGTELYLEYVIVPEHDRSGAITGVLAVGHDLTERKRAEEALRLNELRYRLGQTAAHIGTWEYDLRSECIWGSDEAKRIYGFPLERPYFPPDEVEACIPERQRVHQALLDLIGQSAPYDLEFEIRPADGSEARIISSIAELYRDDQGTPLKVVGVIQDITERKRAEEALHLQSVKLEEEVAERQMAQENLQEKALLLEEEIEKRQKTQDELERLNESLEQRVKERTDELEQANVRLRELDRMKSMFIASMSHELRTPLNSIIGFSSIMLNEWTGPLSVEQRENLETVLRSGKHLLFLVNDVIDVSKIESGKIDAIVEDFDINDVVTEAVKAFKKDIEKKGLELIVQTPDQVLHTDKRRLLQCLLNLLSNATKFTMKGSIGVSTELSADGSMLTITVEDTGIGIGEDDLGRLFSPFVRFHKPGESVIPGTGIGLYLTQKLLREILHGDILVTSTPGVGSRFTMRVPTAVYTARA